MMRGSRGFVPGQPGDSSLRNRVVRGPSSRYSTVVNLSSQAALPRVGGLVTACSFVSAFARHRGAYMKPPSFVNKQYTLALLGYIESRGYPLLERRQGLNARGTWLLDSTRHQVPNQRSWHLEANASRFETEASILGDEASSSESEASNLEEKVSSSKADASRSNREACLQSLVLL